MVVKRTKVVKSRKRAPAKKSPKKKSSKKDNILGALLGIGAQYGMSKLDEKKQNKARRHARKANQGGGGGL